MTPHREREVSSTENVATFIADDDSRAQVPAFIDWLTAEYAKVPEEKRPRVRAYFGSSDPELVEVTYETDEEMAERIAEEEEEAKAEALRAERTFEINDTVSMRTDGTKIQISVGYRTATIAVEEFEKAFAHIKKKHAAAAAAAVAA